MAIDKKTALQIERKQLQIHTQEGRLPEVIKRAHAVLVNRGIPKQAGRTSFTSNTQAGYRRLLNKKMFTS